MSSGGCTRFKQNAWKKDLCINCYKAKEEHQAPQTKPISYPELPDLHPSQSILKGRESKKKKSFSVSFPEEESEVIGYGGDAESSDDDDDYTSLRSEDTENETGGEEEEEKALKLLTKSNTDFNSVLGNLTGEAKTFTNLPLGQQQKQKLQVTVLPFSCGPTSAVKKVEPRPVTIEVKSEESDLTGTSEVKDKLEEVKKVTETRTNPEGRKSQITRGNVITKSHEIVKNKLCSQIKNEKKKALEIDVEEVSQVKSTTVTVASLGCSPTVISSEEVTVKILKLLDGEEGPAESREMAGEPDGKADSDEAEVPTVTPPPRLSFLHRETSVTESKSDPSEPCKSNKRPAPKPPNTPEINIVPPDPPPPPTISRSQENLGAVRVPVKPLEPITTPRRDPPPIPEPKRDEPPPVDKTYEEVEVKPKPLPPPPSSRSSCDFGLAHESTPQRFTGEAPQDKKKSVRMKVSLKKLLRFGTKEDDHKYENEVFSRPRPQIIHPLDLNKSAVQVLTSQTDKSPSSESADSPGSPGSSSSGSSTPGKEKEFLYGPHSKLSPPARPSKPPPPPRSESLNLMERLKSSSNMDNIYANLGESRNGIAPVKPQRSGSLREMKNKQLLIQSDTENFYECVGVSSVPECDMEQQRTAITYYGSETESDLYYPMIVKNRESTKLKLRKKGRNVVHKSLEENYGAVVLANHDALAQLLKQFVSVRHDAPKVFQSCSNYQWGHFRVTDNEDTLNVNDITFLKAEYKSIPVTLAASSSDLRIPEPMGFITKFQDTVSSPLLGSQPVHASVAVLRRMNLETLRDFSHRLGNSVEGMKEGALVLLQLVQHLICSQFESFNLNNYLVFSDNTDPGPTLCYLPPKALAGELNQKKDDCLREACKLFKSGSLLDKSTLAEAQGLLQCWLWGPTTALPLSSLKRWIDLERANALHNSVCSKYLSTPEKLHMAFLVSTNPETLLKALRHLQPNEI